MTNEAQSLLDGRKETLGINGALGPLYSVYSSAAREASTVPFDPLRLVERGGEGVAS